MMALPLPLHSRVSTAICCQTSIPRRQKEKKHLLSFLVRGDVSLRPWSVPYDFSLSVLPKRKKETFELLTKLEAVR